jgi:N-acetylglucosamine kinase-like BadF-type ATPase
MSNQAVRPSGRPPVLLGIDAGGSHTTVVVGDGTGRVLARAEGPASAMKPGAAERSATVMLDTARRATVHAGATLPAALAVVGAAGAGRAPEREALAAALRAAGVAEYVDVRGDIEVGLSAAFGEASGGGILVNAGTGSIAYARLPDGRQLRAGGYGWQLGDEGGGYWLGRRALAAAARSQDGLEESSTLLERLLVAIGLETFDDLIRWTATATPGQVAALAPHVLNAAGEGEAVARRAVEEAAAELARLVEALVRRFPGNSPIPLATAGGLLRTGSPLLDAFRTRVAHDVVRAQPVNGQVDAALGALALAAKLIADT